MHREFNIVSGKSNFKDLDISLLKERKFEARHLIEQMINSDPSKRPTAGELMNHVFFWDGDKKIKLITELSDRLEYKNENKVPLIKKLEEIGKKYNIYSACN